MYSVETRHYEEVPRKEIVVVFSDGQRQVKLFYKIDYLYRGVMEDFTAYGLNNDGGEVFVYSYTGGLRTVASFKQLREFLPLLENIRTGNSVYDTKINRAIGILRECLAGYRC